jgi:predicted O-methyltransferase YrrM
MRFRRPFFPPQDYSHIASGLTEQLELLPKPPEGHISPDQAEFLYHFIRLTRPELAVETGFCVGHSACVIMLAQESVGIEPHLISIDNCQYAETRPAANLLKCRFKNFTLVEGDSRQVLSAAVNRHLREHEGLTLGLGLVDGGHDAETALHDLEALSSFLVLGGYLWLDDFEKIVPCAGANIAGRAFARKWGSCQRFRTSDTRGFMLYQKAF